MFRRTPGLESAQIRARYNDGAFQNPDRFTMKPDLNMCRFDPFAGKRIGRLGATLLRILHASPVLAGLPIILLSTAAQAAPFLPPSRAVDWTSVGIPGGIPSASWPVCATLSPSGTADDSVAIQNALNGAPARSVVLLRPGVYNIHRSSKVGYDHADDHGAGVYECGLYINR
jgi:hypothetical protein